MAVIGFHSSHEQIHPRQLLAGVQHAQAAGFAAALSSDHYRLVDLLQDSVTALDEQGRAELALEGYGYRWLRLMSPESRRLA